MVKGALARGEDWLPPRRLAVLIKTPNRARESADYPTRARVEESRAVEGGWAAL